MNNLLTEGSQANAAPTITEHALLKEFKMAAQSLIEVWYRTDEDKDITTELQKHIDWFRELLA